jgi:hypothetical protein
MGVPTHAVYGRIYTSKGIGIAGVTVHLDDGPTVQTNSAGYYTFPNVPAGTHVVSPEKEDYTFTPAQKTVTVNTTDLVNQNFVGAGP